MKLQIAKLYRGERFMGYGLAVDGKLLDQQLSTIIDSSPGEIPIITATFNMTSEQAENQIIINLTDGVKTCLR